MVSAGRSPWQKTILKIVFMMAVVLGLVLTSGACNKPSSGTQSTAPISVVTLAPTPTVAPTPTPTEAPTPTPETWTQSETVLSGGYYVYFPTNGAYVQAGSTLSLSWSSDGNLEAYIFTQTQFNNFKAFEVPSGYEAYSSGKSQTIYATITNTDTYYAVVANRIILAPSVKLYQATLKNNNLYAHIFVRPSPHFH